MTASSTPGGALSAFLRGVERRGAVFAELQAGDAGVGDVALAATLRAFEGVAPRTPFVEWPRRFWSTLLASPALRGARVPVVRDGPLAVLAGLGTGPRAALLLRLVAGLSEGDAAAVLGVARPTYRLALQGAFPRTADDRPDPELWRAMGEASQQAIRAVPQSRIDRIAALAEGRPDPALARPRAGHAASARWLWPALIAVALVTAAALAATWWWPRWTGVTADGLPRITREPLPEATAPASRYGDETALLTHRDLELLLDAGSGEVASQDPAFDAWLVSALAEPGTEGDASLP